MTIRQNLQLLNSVVGSWDDRIQSVHLDKFTELYKEGGNWAEVLHGDEEYRIALDWEYKGGNECVEPDYRGLREQVFARFPEAGDLKNIGCAMKKTRPNYKKSDRNSGDYIQSVRFYIRTLKAKWRDIKYILQERGFTEPEWDISIYDKAKQALYCVGMHKHDDPTQTVLKIMPHVHDFSLYPSCHWMNASILYGEETLITSKQGAGKPEKKKANKKVEKAKMGDDEKDVVYSDDTLLASALVRSCLSKRRADNYEDWMKVGWALYNVDEQLLDVWIEFSKQSNKYTDGECEKQWARMEDRGLGMGSLKWWAKMDNPTTYDEIISSSVATWIDKCIGSEGAHYDVAMVVYQMFKGRYACDENSNKGCLYYCDNINNLWKMSAKGSILRSVLSTDVCVKFLQRSIYWTQEAGKHEEETARKIFEDKAKKLTAITMKLKTAGYKDSIIKECCALFNIEGFTKKLDATPYTFAFNNCLVDWKQNEIRAILPEDYISITAGYDLPNTFDTEKVNVFMQFFKTIYRKPDVMDYMFSVYTDCMDGRIPQTDHNVFNHSGRGRNGKSASFNVLKTLFGDYCQKADINMLCEKRAGAGNHKAHYVPLKNARLVYMTEPDRDGDRLNAGITKELSGGEPIPYRAIYGEQDELVPKFYMHILCNNSMDLDGEDEALGMRLKVIQYESTFTKEERLVDTEKGVYLQDPTIEARVKEVVPYVVRMLIEKRFKEGRVNVPEIVMNWSAKYRGDRNPIKLFVDDMLERVDVVNGKYTRNDIVTFKDLQVEYKQWASQNGMRKEDVNKKPTELRESFVKLLGECIETKKISGKCERSVFLGWKMRRNTMEDDDSDMED